MWSQLRTLAWAQVVTFRNHLPRTGIGALIAASIAIVWYGVFGVIAVFIATSLPDVPVTALPFDLSIGLLCVFLFWQLVPLVTLTAGWSLDLKRLQIYPVSTDTLLVTQALLLVSNGFEMELVLAGTCTGLLFHPDVPFYAAVSVLLFIPFNLLVSLTTRQFFSRVFRKNRLREILTVLLLSIGLLPQLAIHLGWAEPLGHGFLRTATLRWAPWHDVAAMATDTQPWLHLLAILVWIGLAWAVARRQLISALGEEEILTTALPRAEGKWSIGSLLESPARLFRDPLAALVTKEIRALLRMPRFRVIFLLASAMTLLILIPLSGSVHSKSFLGENTLLAASLYGILIVGEALIWNTFGFDRSAAQLYFAAPVSMRDVFVAKNAVAALFVILQNAISLGLARVLGIYTTPSILLNALCVTPALCVFYLAAGNLTSVTFPRPMDPKATVKKQTAGITQAWVLGCTVGSLVLIGAAALAGWALQSAWAMRAVFLVEFLIGLIVYRVSLDSALARTSAQQEEILASLTKGASMVA
jgi:ABC-2 type transport system permease protein